MSLDSWQFLALGATAVVVCRVAGSSGLRQAVLLVLNAVFLSSYLASAQALAVLLGLLAAVYALGELKLARGRAWSSLAQVVAVTGLWAFLFLVKEPRLLAPANPFFHFPVQLIGVSYLVLRGITYLMEVDLAPRRSLASYLNYMLFFPALLAGPIERYADFRKRLAEVRGEPADILPALHRIANGCLKKFALADNLSVFGAGALPDVADVSLPLLWVAALAGLFLVYLDFSGYCEIVIGLAELMGLRLSENFDRPFAARNVQEFWERWHITLTSILRDYVFNPLSKAAIRYGPPRWQFALIVASYAATMMLVALWHGTTWGFVLFGLLHAGALVAVQLRRRWRRRPLLPAGMGDRMAALCTYAFVSVSLLLWTSTLPECLTILRRLLGLDP